jgi:hypothetical protein
MPRLGRVELSDEQPNFSGGLNIASDRSKLRDNELWTAGEIRFTEFGGATKRGGTQRIHVAALAAHSRTRRVLVAASGRGDRIRDVQRLALQIRVRDPRRADSVGRSVQCGRLSIVRCVPGRGRYGLRLYR